MAGTTISGITLTNVTLNGPADNPAYVTGTIDVTSGVALMGSSGTAWTITNSGLVRSTASYGIQLSSGGTVTNISGGTISGFSGIYQGGAPGTVVNAGIITGIGGFGFGVELHAGGQITNQAGGTISGAGGLYIGGGPGVVINAAGIIGTASTGILLNSGGIVSNQGTGMISGTTDGIQFGQGAGTS